MGQYLREDFGPEFGIDGVFIGMLKDQLHRKMPFETIGMYKVMKEAYYGGNHYPTMLSFGGMNEMGKNNKQVELGKTNWPKNKQNMHSCVKF